VTAVDSIRSMGSGPELVGGGAAAVAAVHTNLPVDVAGFVVDDDAERVDVDAVWQFLSTQAYWGRWRRREDLAAQVRSAWRVAGVYRCDNGALVGFARAVSDGVSLAYLADVFITPGHRGRGPGKLLVAVLVALRGER